MSHKDRERESWYLQRCSGLNFLCCSSTALSQPSGQCPLSFPNTQLEMNHKRESNQQNQVQLLFVILFWILHFFSSPLTRLLPLCSPLPLLSLHLSQLHLFLLHFFPLMFLCFFPYNFTLSTVSARPLWSREDWTTDWTIYFWKDTSVSNHSISPVSNTHTCTVVSHWNTPPSE